MRRVHNVVQACGLKHISLDATREFCLRRWQAIVDIQFFQVAKQTCIELAIKNMSKTADDKITVNTWFK